VLLRGMGEGEGRRGKRCWGRGGCGEGQQRCRETGSTSVDRCRTGVTGLYLSFEMGFQPFNVRSMIS